MKNNTHQDTVFADCVLHQEATNGTYKPDYHYPSNGLPPIGAKPVPGFSMLAHLLNKGNKK